MRDTIEIGSISDKVCNILRKSIITKTIGPGERLVEAKIAKSLNVSITPVRHAFAQLFKEGIISITPYKGTKVVDINSKLIKEVYSVRKLLEKQSVELAFPKITSSDLARLEEYAKEMQQLARANKMYELGKVNIVFHKVFFEISEHDVLKEMYQLLESRIQLLQSYGRPAEGVKENFILDRHMKIINAIKYQDYRLTMEMIEEHIDSSAKMLSENLRF